MPTVPRSKYVHPVAAYRLRHGVSLSQLAERCDPPMHKTQIHRIETCQRKPTFDQIVALVAACEGEFTADDIVAAAPKNFAA